MRGGLFTGLQGAVRDLGWRVDEEVWLSTYTFESLVLYNDLKNLVEAALQHPLVIGLARAGSASEPSEALGEEQLDSLPTPEQVPIPVLMTDSSQLKALTLARSGRPLVVHGPPGTGKSQTIANLIADALGQNKRVLFVSAKMAALDVVHDRLKRLGLDRFCLEAHSTKAGKTKVIDELRRTLDGAQDALKRQPEQPLTELLRIREQLNAYVRELHTPRPPLQLTIYQALGAIEKLRNAPSIRGALPWKEPLEATRTLFRASLEALDDLAAQAAVFDGRAGHPWRGLWVADSKKPIDREALETDLLSLRDGVGKITTEVGCFGRTWEIPAESLSYATVRALVSAFQRLATLDRLPVNWAIRDLQELHSTITLLSSAASNADELSAKRAQHRQAFKVPPREALDHLQEADTRFRGWYRVLSPAYWRWRGIVRGSLQPAAPADFKAIKSYLDRSRRIVALERWFKEKGSVLAQDAGGSPTGELLRAAAKRLRATADVRAALEACQLPAPSTNPPLSDDGRRNATELLALATSAALDEAATRIDSLWPGGFVDGVSARQAGTRSVAARCDEALGNMAKLQEWIVLQLTLGQCRSLGLMPFIEALGDVTAGLVRTAFERRFYVSWANAGLDASPSLVAFSGPRREDQIARFRLLDNQLREAGLAQCKLAASEPARRVANAQPVGAGGDVAILRRELEKRKRIKPLRKLFGEIPGVLQALKPCFLMSPLSVSTFLRPGTMSFDLVVFDEASQLPTAEAVPAILRGTQVVVAGDKNQLPPTSFFDASVIFDEDSESEDLEPLESLLDECVSIWPVFEQTHLRWHYRSRDERLVRFSNHYFYREKPLITFPSPIRESDKQGVSALYVPDGIWDKGKSRTNRQEARVVAELVVEQLQKHPDRSVGVVAMNANQREAIEESIDELLPRHPTVVPLLGRGGDEPFFIKSLENVQGDERDTIVISVGYGKSSSGTISYNFGPLNQDAGWRRLNVLVTRARWQTILVTSMRSHELSGINPANRGASALRDFIAYAELNGELPAEVALPTRAETNDFEDGVAAALRARGLQIDEQVGTSDYRIDLAVRDPRDTTKYVLGIECDGATYHSARTARDRDLVRHLALRELGWRLYRIWSTDWFRNPDQAVSGVLRALEVAIKSPVEESVPAPARQVQTEAPAESAGSGAPAAASITASKRYPGGRPYTRFNGSGGRELLLNSDYVRALADQLTRVLESEGPMHAELMTERLKEVNGVGRAGKNVKATIHRAIRIAEQSHAVTVAGDFLHRNGASCATFRIPGDGVTRPLAWIPREEIELAVMHVVEDQFGYQREALPHAISEVFGFERASAGVAETIGGVVDDLVERGMLRVSGPNVYLP